MANADQATKRQKALAGKVDSTKLYPLDNALAIVKECATAKFDESIDVAVQLGIDAKKSDQVVRGAVVMPNGTGKTKRVAVFAQGAKAEEAKAAGADIVGMEDLAERDQGRQDEFRRRHRLARHDARRRHARPDPRPARPDAEPEGRHGDARRRPGGSQCQGRPGAVPRRQGRHRPRDDRPPLVRVATSWSATCAR